MAARKWDRFLCYMNHHVRAECTPQRESLRGTPFEWLQNLSGKTFGDKVGPLIVRFFLQDEQEKAKNRGHDFAFRGRKIELKTSVEHATEGVFLFEQIRPQQDWDGLLCLRIIKMDSLVFFALSRSIVEEAIAAWRSSGSSPITPQHGGARYTDRDTARPDTFWMWTKPEWAPMLAPMRSTFGPSGWRGPKLVDTLAVI